MAQRTNAWLYSFRRCPYAIRARLALKEAKVPVQVREIVLRDKPASMLGFAPVGTVPVLVLNAGETVLSDSLDIMCWALAQHDPLQRLHHAEKGMDQCQQVAWINAFLADFKPQLDAYKYFQRHPERSQHEHRQTAVNTLLKLEQALQQHPYLHADRPLLTDLAVFAFVRQFAGVDRAWFYQQTSLTALRAWLDQQLDTALFSAVMPRYPLWQDDALGPCVWL